MQLKAILFDLDNTLMDRDHMFRSFAAQLTQECLVPMEETQREALIAEMIERDNDGYRPKEGFFQELLDWLPWRHKTSLEELKAYYNQHYMTYAKAMDYAEETLRYCRNQKLRLGIITNGHSKRQHEKIDLIHLRPYFDAIIVSGDVDIQKPDPRIYQLALDRLGVQAEETVIVGDHPRNDIWGAAQAGIRGIWLKRKHEWDESLEGGTPWRTVQELDEVPALLEPYTQELCGTKMD
ncbi:MULTISPECIES: HAD family hydrolase [Paenibacillus]|uniref:Haloacid dehalogenase, type II n=1 Tax=Paenibacillus barengoltzii G22 TaxID=1235795 RepID=R9LDV5_9BACL|nr:MULTISPECIES: HAD family hydrolase [Paenibacillus]EOS56895.1 haloacid dehalogenase, type II [Paenibacillus barengoltzii G22]MDU0328909.1 HAD family hydrolase [Paenibacillus sp. 3LSP]